MDEPARWCENDASNGTRLPGLPVPSGGPTFLSRRPILTRENCLSSDLAIHRDARLRQHVLDLRFAQSGGVIFK